MVLVDAGQCLLQATDFLVPHALPTRRSARNQEEAWPGQLRTSCPIYKLGRAGKDRPVPALGWGGHPSWVVCKGIVHHSSFLGFTPLVVIISKFQLLNYSYLNPWTWVWSFFSVFFPILLENLGTGVSEHLCGTSVLDGVKPEDNIKPFNYTFQQPLCAFRQSLYFSSYSEYTSSYARALSTLILSLTGPVKVKNFCRKPN